MDGKQHIVLIGMPASGKTTIGRIVAEKLGYDFIDGDDLLIKRFGKKLPVLIAEVGEEGFIELEDEEFLHLELKGPTVLAPGGSIIYASAAMEHLRRIATVVYLETPLAEIKKRIPDIEARGIIGSKQKPFEILFAEREVLYKKYADLVVDNSHQNPETTAQHIAALVH